MSLFVIGFVVGICAIVLIAEFENNREARKDWWR